MDKTKSHSETWGRCTKDECEHQDDESYCTLMECIYDIDKDTLDDMAYHKAVDEGRIR